MLSLFPNDVHIWQQSLAVSPQQVQRLSALLSQDEHQRANRFRRHLNRQQYIVGRGSLRRILSQYLHLKPEQIQFGYSPLGKPFLTTNNVSSSLQFNLSHSGQQMLVAVSAGSRIGIDVEYAHRNLEPLALSKRYFSPQEQQLLSTSSPGQSTRLFLQLWTCKEALLKASGSGLRDLDRIEVLALPQSSADQVLFAYQPRYQNFTLRVLPAPSDYIAAIAVEGQGAHSMTLRSLAVGNMH